MSSGPSFEKSNVEEKTEQNILQEGFSMSSTNQETLHINVSTLLFLKKKKINVSTDGSQSFQKTQRPRKGRNVVGC